MVGLGNNNQLTPHSTTGNIPLFHNIDSSSELLFISYPSLILLVGAIFLLDPVQNHPFTLRGCKSGRSQPSKSQSLASEIWIKYCGVK